MSINAENPQRQFTAPTVGALIERFIADREAGASEAGAAAAEPEGVAAQAGS